MNFIELSVIFFFLGGGGGGNKTSWGKHTLLGSMQINPCTIFSSEKVKVKTKILKCAKNQIHPFTQKLKNAMLLCKLLVVSLLAIPTYMQSTGQGISFFAIDNLHVELGAYDQSALRSRLLFVSGQCVGCSHLRLVAHL